MAKKVKRYVAKGITHGLSGYTNDGCRCPVCTEANAEAGRDYRDRRFAGRPLCFTPNCHRVASRATGDGYCYLCSADKKEAKRKKEAQLARRRKTRKKVAA